jgi:16S rRNA (cytosine967-C5)-methyltransferase
MTPRPRTNPARKRALDIILACSEGQPLAHELLDEMRSAEPLSQADEGLVYELSLGTIRHRLTCEHIAAHFYRGRWEGLSLRLRCIIALGVYQLCWLTRVPDHAAVDETVQLARTCGSKAAALANALLRKIADARGEIMPVTVPSHLPPTPRRFLRIDEHQARLFTEDIFPDPARRPLDYLVTATSHPPYLVERWHRRFKPLACHQICAAGTRRPRLVLRVNTLRITVAQFQERLTAAGRTFRCFEDSTAIELTDHAALAQLPEFAEGLCQPQDSTAQRAMLLAAPSPGEFVVDLCAGAGTKATHAAELIGGHGLVIACDPDTDRLTRLDANAARLGTTIVQKATPAGLDAEIARAGRPPDLIVLDVPCTNTGALARRPEARYRASHKSLLALAAVQREILSNAVRLAGPATRMLYSTCSIEREENEDQMEWFIGQHEGWRIGQQKLTLPDDRRDGGFAAMLRQS